MGARGLSGLSGSTRRSLPGWCRSLKVLGIATEEPSERSAPFPGIGESSGGAACADPCPVGAGLPAKRGCSGTHSRASPSKAPLRADARGAWEGATAVRPRGRGERVTPCCCAAVESGSSPRARGTLRRGGIRLLQRRFIPAGAGNTPHGTRIAARTAVHPRGRGEHKRPPADCVCDDGSSPRARGTRERALVEDWAVRFIPAGAGNTRSTPCCATSRPVHPRGRGEHAAGVGALENIGGSSPRARGTHAQPRRGRAARRFIPAGAGNT